jgi:O-antigen/teichoic acid export membrane protein
MNTADKILIAGLLTREQLGIYGVGGLGVTIMGTIPSGVGQMLFVKFAEMDGQNKTKEYMAEVIDKTIFILSSLFAPLICVAISCFPIAVVFLLPQYAGGIPAGELLIASTFFLGTSLPVTNWYVSTGRYVPVLAVRIVVVAVQFLALYFVILNDLSLEFVALCVLCAFAIFSIAIMTLARDLERSMLVRFGDALKNQLPFSSILTAIWFQGYVYPVNVYAPSVSLFMSSVLGLVVSLTVSVPFIFWSNKKAPIMRLLLDRVLGERKPILIRA